MAASMPPTVGSTGYLSFANATGIGSHTRYCLQDGVSACGYQGL